MSRKDALEYLKLNPAENGLKWLFKTKGLYAVYLRTRGTKSFIEKSIQNAPRLDGHIIVYTNDKQYRDNRRAWLKRLSSCKLIKPKDAPVKYARQKDGGKMLLCDLTTGNLIGPALLKTYSINELKMRDPGHALFHGPAGVTVRTFTNETVCIKKEDGSIQRVPIKELRSFIAAYEWGADGSLQIIWKKLPPEEVEKMYSINSATEQYIGLAVDKRDHRFV
jgi:hypothetical protein